MTIEHHPERSRFEAIVDGHHGHLEYRIANGVMTIPHTHVDPALEGRGLGGRLMQAALDHAKASGLKVEPSCSYASAYMKRHPETMSLHV